MEFLLDTGATSSIINYRTFRELFQFQQDLELSRSNNTTRNYYGQIIPMMGYISLRLYYDSDGQHNFPLTVWITEMKTQNLLGMNFCQEQINKIHFDLPGIELKRPLNTFCYGSLQLNKVYPYVSQILTVKIPHSMYIELKTTRCYKFASENANSFPPGSTFLPNRKAVSTRPNFINVLCTQFEKTLPIVMENNKAKISKKLSFDHPAVARIQMAKQI